VHASNWREPDTTYSDFSRFACRSRKVERRRVRFGTHFISKAWSKPYINAKFFIHYIRTVFFPNLNELRALEEFADEDAIH
jgi:hypothetical protein